MVKILTEELANQSMSQEELAEYTGLSPKTITDILSSECPITPEIALKLEPIFQLPAHLWINLEQRYQEILARLVESENSDFTDAIPS